MPATTVSAPTRVTRMIAGVPDHNAAGAQRFATALLASGADSPQSSASSTRHCALSSTPSAGTPRALGDDHPIARHELERTHAHQRSVGLDAIGEHRRQPRERVGQVAGAVARAHFEVATDAKEEDEHADRLEPDIGAAGEDLDDAPRVDERDGERHRDIHAEPSRR